MSARRPTLLRLSAIQLIIEPSIGTGYIAQSQGEPTALDGPLHLKVHLSSLMDVRCAELQEFKRALEFSKVLSTLTRIRSSSSACEAVGGNPCNLSSTSQADIK